MFRNKKDVDRHVQEALRKVKTETERNLLCFNFGKLYASVGDHETARRYVSSYLVVKPEVHGAHKVLAQSLEALGQKEKALDAYKTVLALDSAQKDVILKVCELLVDVGACNDLGRARYWCERADQLYPHHPVVFRLKEHLLTAEGEEPDSYHLKKLISTEMTARPMDVKLHIRLLRLYLDSEQLAEAYQHAKEVESRPAFWDLPEWYQCLSEVYRAHHTAHRGTPSEVTQLSWEFYAGYLGVLDRAAALALMELAPKSLQACTQAVFVLDQSMLLAAALSVPASHRQYYQELLHHYQGQLCLHLATLVLKKAKKDCNMWRESCRVAAPLLLGALTAPPDPHAPWITQLSEERRKTAQRWIMQASYRRSQAGHTVLALVVDTRTQFKERCAQACAGNWRERIYQRLFARREHHAAIDTSHFVNHNAFARPALDLPTVGELRPHDEVSQLCAPGSLHLQVWVGLRNMERTYRARGYDTMQLVCSNINQAGAESLCRMDVDAFLYSTVFCAESLASEEDTPLDEHRPAVLPYAVARRLCTEEQTAWWSAMHRTHTGEHDSAQDPALVRTTLQRGIECVRTLGNHGLELGLVVRLAKVFQARAAALTGSTVEVGALQARAALYWGTAITLIERTQRKQVIYAPEKRLFDYRGKELAATELSLLLEEGRLYLALRLKATGQLEVALEQLEQLTSPDASFHSAEIYVAMATAELEESPRESITSEMRSRNIILLTRARDSLYLTEDRLRAARHRDHPLHSIIKEHLDDIESRLNRIDPDVCRNDGNRRAHAHDPGSDESGSSIRSGGVNSSSVVPLLLTPRNHRHNTSTPLRSAAHRHTEHHDGQDKRHESHGRTDAVLHSLQSLLQQNTAILESNKEVVDLLKGVMEEIKCIKLAVGDLTEFKRDMLEQRDRRAHASTDLAAPDDLYFCDEDFVEDPAQLSAAPLGSYVGPGYGDYGQHTGLLGTNTVTYGQPPFHDPAFMLFPPTMGYYGTGALPFSEGQQLPNFRTPYLGAPPQPPAPVNVVITTSDALPTHPVPPQPALSVTVPAQHRAPAPAKLRAPHAFQIKMPEHSLPLEQASRLEKESAALSPVLPIPVESLLSSVPDPVYSAVTAEDDDSLVEHESSVEFTPVIPLPAEVEVNTGEQDEEVLYTCRAKLYRFVDKEWKERGVGTLKLLRHTTTGRMRLLMRRDQVLKICANHLLTPNMELTRISPRAWIWAANDFADEQVRLEKLCARFKNEDEALNFKEAFESAVRSAPADASPLKCAPPTTAPSTTEPSTNVTTTVTSTTVPAVTTTVPSVATSTPVKFVAGGFTFATSPTFKVPPPAVATPPAPTASKPGPFAGFTFTSNSPTLSTAWGSIVSDKPMFESPHSALSFTNLPDSKDTSFKGDMSFKGFSGAGAAVFGGAKSADNSARDEEDGKGDDFVPTAEFAPVIALPDLITVRTGEEGEVAVFEERAKLLRFDRDIRQWKERGIGRFRLLHDPESGRVRLLMRREQVLKVCCNHRLTANMEFMAMTTTDKAYTWTAQDFSEGEEGRPELLAIRFKTSDLAANFKAAVDRTQAAMIDDKLPTKPGSKPSEPAPISELFKPAQGSWECPGCYSRSSANQIKCPACQTSKPGANQATPVTTTDNQKTLSSTTANQKTPSSTQKPLSELFKPKPGSWECSGCYSRCEASQAKCPSCDTANPANQKTPSLTPTNQKTPSSTPTNQKTQSLLTTNQKTSSSTTANQKTPSSTQKPLSELFKPKPGSWECSGCYSRCEASTAKCPSCDTANPANQKTESSSGTNMMAGDGVKFTFGVPTSTTPTCSALSWSTSAPSTFTFGSTTPVDIPAMKQAASKFTFGDPSKFEFSFSGVRPATSPGRVASSPGEQCDSEGDHEDDEGDHIYFSPVVPLPDKVAVCTGEEEEEAVYCHRAKLFRFIGGEWKERGVGDFKILRHTQTHKIRLLMRRDQILKICLNHHLTTELVFTSKDDKTWMWSAADFSENTMQMEQFALRFKSADIAQEFKQALDEALMEVTVNGNTSPDVSSRSTAIDGAAPALRALSLASGDHAGKKGVARTLFGSPQSDASLTVDEDEIKVLYEAQVTDEERAAAARLQLPPNFYAYKHNPRRCPGCVGCDPPSDDDSPTLSSLLESPLLPANTTPIFGQPVFTSSTATAASIFGQPGTTTPLHQWTTPLFGQSATTTPLFGQPATTTPLFGQPATNTPLFGQPATTTPLFGQPVTTTPLIGQPATTTPLFGQPATTTPLFGQQATTTTHLFGQSPTVTASLFGASSIFGKPSNTTPASTPQSGKTTTVTPVIFGQTPAATPGIFGQTPAATPVIFGQTPAATPVIFGQTPAATPVIFGQTPAATPVIFGQTPAATPVIFGQTPAATPVIFGQTSATTPVVFGQIGLVAAPLFGQGTKKSPLFDTPPNSSTSIFGGLKTEAKKTPAPDKQENGGTDIPFLPVDSTVSFANLASATKDTALKPAQSPGFAWSGAGTALFSSPVTLGKDEEAEEADSEDGPDPDPQFEPLVPLPAAIEVRTGEESETRVFCQRAKLYRYAAETKEWKERGVGELKILHGSGTYRLLMRREQVHKLVLNELITPELSLKPMQSSDKAWCWGSHNYADGKAQLDELAVRFAQPETAMQFKAVVDECIEDVVRQRAAAGVEAVDDDDDDEDYDGVEMVMLEARATLEVRNSVAQDWGVLGNGTAQLTQANSSGGDYLLVKMLLDESEEDQPMFLCAVDSETEMACNDTHVEWSVHEYLDEAETEVITRSFRLTLESPGAALEFHQCLEDGKLLHAGQQEEEEEDEDD